MANVDKTRKTEECDTHFRNILNEEREQFIGTGISGYIAKIPWEEIIRSIKKEKTGKDHKG